MRSFHHVYTAAYHGPHQPTGPARCVSPVGYFIWPHMNHAGNRVVFWGRGATEIGFNIWLASVDGTRLEKITHDRALTGHPSWRADGREIVFTSSLGLCDLLDWSMSMRMQVTPQNVYVMDPDGGNRRQLTHGHFADGRPSYTPDGQSVVFVSNRSGAGTSHLFRVEIDTGKLTQITTGSLLHWRPMVSPDGKKLCYFTMTSSESVHELAIMDLASGKVEYPIDRARFIWVHGPAWTPDGKAIVMHAKSHGRNNCDLWHMDLATGELSMMQLPGFTTAGHFTLDAAMRVMSYDSAEVPAERSAG